MATLAILTGTSGAGKTRQISKLEEVYGPGRVLTVTDRARRVGETDDDYHFVSKMELVDMEKAGETLWVIDYHGNRYSITARAIWEPILNNRGLAYVAITPDYHAFLAK